METGVDLGAIAASQPAFRWQTEGVRLWNACLVSISMGVVCLVLLLGATAFAQNITGTITGAVEDPTGAGVPQVTVVTLSTDRGISYRTVTGAAGVYVLPLLPLGNYQVTIEAAGFKRFVRDGLTLGADERLRVESRSHLPYRGRCLR